MVIFFSDAAPLGRVLVKKLTGRLGWLSHHYHPGRIFPADDALSVEIRAAERAVAQKLAIRRSQRKRQTQPPVTREEKILDLAG